MISHEDVTIQIDGRKITGTYSVRAGAQRRSVAISMLVTSPSSPGAFIALARDMLLELALEGKG
jgi:hypothetical protein